MLTELVRSGAATVDDKGRITNRRMVREAKVSAERSRAGRQGALATNARRQTGRQNSGKRVDKQVGKPVGNDLGKDAGKQAGKMSANESDLSADDISTFRDEPPSDVRQNPGNAVGNTTGKEVGKDLGKGSASSYFSPNGDSLKGEPLQGSPPEESSPPIATRESAGGAPHAIAMGRPKMADRLSALVEERRKAVAAS